MRYYDPLRFGPPPGPSPVDGLLPPGLRLVEEDDLLHQGIPRFRRLFALAVVLLFGLAMVTTSVMTAATGYTKHLRAQAAFAGTSPYAR